MDSRLIEEVAKRYAVANNGGDWADHYTEKHKNLWRRRASELIEFIRNSDENFLKKSSEGINRCLD